MYKVPCILVPLHQTLKQYVEHVFNVSVDEIRCEELSLHVCAGILGLSLMLDQTLPYHASYLHTYTLLSN